jgi:drug/metabolite transporter (DMT)-like permease
VLGIGFAVLFAAMMGVASIFSRRGLEKGSFIALLFISLAIGAPNFLVISFFTTGGFEAPLVGIAYAGVGAILGSVVGRSFYFLGIAYLGPGKSLSIYATSPLYAAILAWIILGESITLPVIVGTLAIVFGIVALSTDARAETERAGHSLRVVFVPAIGAVLASGAVTLRKLALDVGVAPIEAATINMVVGFLVVSPVVLTRYRDTLHYLPRESLRNFVIASTIMALGFVFYFFGLRATNASVFFPLVQTQPLFAVVLSALFLDDLEIVTRWTALASIAIVAGAALVIVG